MAPPTPDRRVFTRTFGCQMNVHDSARMVQVLADHAYAPTEDATHADVIILNTCSVRDRAEKKVLSELGRLAPLKEVNPGLILVVAGCVAQQEGDRLLAKAPQLDAVVGPDQLGQLPELLERVRSSRAKVVETRLVPSRDFEFIEALPRAEQPVTDYVTIMKGCDKVCAFCIVPYTRGREVSKPAEMVVREVRRLVRGGVREVMLLGQNVNSYGKDRTGRAHFAELLRQVDAVEELARLRFTTSHPMDCTDELIDSFGDLHSLCEYFHLPIQAGSDRILRAMRRPYTVERYLELVARLRHRCPELALATDIIVGFPGETERDFEQTLEVLREVRFDSIYAFKYSPRPGTKAARMADDVPLEEKKRRLAEVFAVQQPITRRAMQRYGGQRVEILIEGPSRKSARSVGGAFQLQGRTRTNVVVNVEVDPEDFATGCWIGELAQVKVEDVRPHSLHGSLARAATPGRTEGAAVESIETS